METSYLYAVSMTALSLLLTTVVTVLTKTITRLARLYSEKTVFTYQNKIILANASIRDIIFVTNLESILHL